MAVDYSRVKSDYYVKYKWAIAEKERNGFPYRVYEEFDLLLKIEKTVKFISQYVTDEVKMLHFVKQEILEGKYTIVNFKIRFL